MLDLDSQRIIRYPGRRGPHQLDRAADRMDEEHKRLDRIKKERGKEVSHGLTAKQIETAQDIAVRAAMLGLHHAPALHYTQDARRWQGINSHLVAAKGHYPNYADCSSFLTWCWWNALTQHFHLDDILNDQGWGAGYTGTLMVHGHPTGGKLEPGNAVIYGYKWPGVHTAIVAHDPRFVISHGSEGAPYYVPVDYRKDILTIRDFL